jgi:hypothetical protein
MRHNFVGRLMGRLAGVIGGLLAVGIILRLILAVLEPVLPAPLMRDVLAGWGMFYDIISPAMAPTIAIGVLCAVGWIILGSRK